MKVCTITATRGRHRHLERVVRFMLNQDYDGEMIHLIYNNHPEELRLNGNLSSDKFLLINNHLNLKTLKPYNNLGDIYNDIMRFVPEDVEVINFMDDDDIYLPNHTSEGIRGLRRGGKKAYKPKFSYYAHLKRVTLANNNLEPSIFVMVDHIREYGFSSETTAQHLKWLDPLVINGEIFEDPEGKPTYICDWSQEIPTFKTSGAPQNPNNYNNYINSSLDNGDKIITPVSQSWAEHYYNKINKVQ